METAKISYQGSLRTEAVHVKSGSKILTDAPTDNHGKGEQFSPTDLVSAALASCMLTVIGIYCEKHELSMSNGHATVVKKMSIEPRRIAEIEIALDLSGNGWDEKTQKIVQKVAETCPVARSLHPETNILVHFNF